MPYWSLGKLQNRSVYRGRTKISALTH